jgi:hypothetical protein
MGLHLRLLTLSPTDLSNTFQARELFENSLNQTPAREGYARFKKLLFNTFDAYREKTQFPMASLSQISTYGANVSSGFISLSIGIYFFSLLLLLCLKGIPQADERIWSPLKMTCLPTQVDCPLISQ